MEKEKVYISGKITGLPFEDVKANFAKAAVLMETRGYEVVNPLKNGLPKDASWEEHMREDLKMLLDCDFIYMQSNYMKSRGAKLELAIATQVGIKPMYE